MRKSSSLSQRRACCNLTSRQEGKEEWCVGPRTVSVRPIHAAAVATTRTRLYGSLWCWCRNSVVSVWLLDFGGSAMRSLLTGETRSCIIRYLQRRFSRSAEDFLCLRSLIGFLWTQEEEAANKRLLENIHVCTTSAYLHSSWRGAKRFIHCVVQRSLGRWAVPVRGPWMCRMESSWTTSFCRCACETFRFCPTLSFLWLCFQLWSAKSQPIWLNSSPYSIWVQFSSASREDFL